jgi:hypothetical protein
VQYFRFKEFYFISEWRFFLGFILYHGVSLRWYGLSGNPDQPSRHLCVWPMYFSYVLTASFLLKPAASDSIPRRCGMGVELYLNFCTDHSYIAEGAWNKQIYSKFYRRWPYSGIYFQLMHKSQSLFNLIIALHVSSVTITHLQEHKITVSTASGNHYTILLSAAIMEKLKLIWVCCGWRTPPTTHSNQFQLFHDSSRQEYCVMVTRCCRCSYFVLLKMGDIDARNM